MIDAWIHMKQEGQKYLAKLTFRIGQDQLYCVVYVDFQLV